MKEEKKSFIVYCDIIETLDELTDEQAGKLFKGMAHYSNDGTEPNFDTILKFVFIPIRQQMDRDEAKWQGIKEARSRAGKKGGEKSVQVKKEKKKIQQENAKDVTLFKQSQAKPSKSKQSQANQPVNVNVNVNDNVNVNVNVNDNVIQLSSALLRRMGGHAEQDFEPCNEVLNDIADLVEKGHTEEEFNKVVDYKWEDFSEEVPFLYTPDVLFGEHFEEFLKQAEKEEPPTDERHPERAENEQEEAS